MGSTRTRRVLNIERKRELWSHKEIDCHICPYHRKENSSGKARRAARSRGKINHRRLK